MQKFMALQQRVPKTQVWATTKVVTFALDPFVLACVLHQSKGH